MSPGLEGLRATLRAVAGGALARAHPDYVATLRRVMEETGDLDRAHAAVASIPTDAGFSKWRKLLLSLYDVEMQMIRVRSALRLHGVVIDLGTLQSWSMNEGSWVDYHQAMWLLSMDGLLERVQTLIKQGVRELIRPFDPSHWQDIEKRLSAVPADLLAKLAPLRNPVAHGGGPIEAVANERLLEGMAVFQAWPDPLVVLQDQQRWQARWQQLLEQTSTLAFGWTEAVFGEIEKAVPWDEVRRQWC